MAETARIADIPHTRASTGVQRFLKGAASLCIRAMDRNEIVQRREAFRSLARCYADCATRWLDDADERSAIYAALDLRFALEALAYDLASDYLEELGDPAALEWQAPKLIERLIGIDPYAGSTVYLSKVDPETGEKITVASDVRMDLKKLKIRYQKLNSALHAPTIAKVESGKPRSMDNLRHECRNILKIVEKVLGSQMMTGGVIHHQMFVMNCACGTVVKRRTDPLFFHRDDPSKGSAAITVRCWKCKNSVQISLSGDNYEVSPNVFGFDCPHEGCGKENSIWEKDLADGFEMDCAHCGSSILMSAALRPVVAEIR
ncbi:hypothetical protein [Novosphingobium sp. JCM 18896]|uniref:hypothetical protein n=1 Tax=Novosphingobium sp. JCM 18896 TaxID=2989731 RepID=UPI002223722A|nr:hypothetical protein [Novosphingobium sp. JCM 18896]MCW1430022.1 hypothetical protein [Novosphingobium sp. JCM 18896]